TRAECDYNIEYFSVLDDILNGRILDRKPLYEQFAREKQLKGLRSAYHELFHRLVRWEIFWDVISIWFSVLFWLYVIVFISYPWVKVLWQMIQGWESRELLME
ncbi:MAG: hypothetical protein U1D99_04435, partial [Candidatus Omnitrophota bacterium]|nr:hypothetical protein [Candidatus Omnitrophota bacterium]